MKLTVVTISHNQSEYLEECMNSVLSQNADVEYIVVDALSGDGSIDILKAAEHRLSRLIVEKDNGPAHGLNKGFGCASGDIYYYLNSDDVVVPNAFREALRLMANCCWTSP